MMLCVCVCVCSETLHSVCPCCARLSGNFHCCQVFPSCYFLSQQYNSSYNLMRYVPSMCYEMKSLNIHKFTDAELIKCSFICCISDCSVVTNTKCECSSDRGSNEKCWIWGSDTCNMTHYLKFWKLIWKSTKQKINVEKRLTGIYF